MAFGDRFKHWADSDMSWKDWIIAPVGVTKGLIKGGKAGYDYLKGSDEEKQGMLDAMRQAGDQYGAYRPTMAQAQMNSLDSIRQLYAPSAGMLTEMTGGRFAPDMSSLTRSPLDASALGSPHQAPTAPYTGGPNDPRRMGLGTSAQAGLAAQGAKGAMGKTKDPRFL